MRTEQKNGFEIIILAIIFLIKLCAKSKLFRMLRALREDIEERRSKIYGHVFNVILLSLDLAIAREIFQPLSD